MCTLSRLEIHVTDVGYNAQSSLERQCNINTLIPGSVPGKGWSSRPRRNIRTPVTAEAQVKAQVLSSFAKVSSFVSVLKLKRKNVELRTPLSWLSHQLCKSLPVQ